jgi:hypothetical protein
LILAVHGTDLFLVVENELIETRGSVLSFIKKKLVNPCRGQVPYGFDVNEFNELVINLQEQEIIKQMLEMHRNQESLTGIAKQLNRENVITKNKGRWHANSIGNIIERNKMQ